MKIKDTEFKIIYSPIADVNADCKIYHLCKDAAPKKEDWIRLTVAKSLRLAQSRKFKSIVFTDIAESLRDFPKEGAAKIMTQEILKFLRENKPAVEKIWICLSDPATYAVFDKTVRRYVEHILYKFSEGPFVTVDCIIELENGIILIERSNPPYGWALPGGFVDYGESLEEAVTREVKEETNMNVVNLRQLHTYSKPGRDPRFHTVTTVFAAQGRGKPKSGDDAKGLKIVKLSNLMKLDYAFDHKEVIKDYLRQRNSRLKKRK